jgi:hypothetical protein
MAEDPFHEFAFAPMCTSKGVSWFATAFIRHTRRDAQNDFIKAIAGNGHGWRVLEAQGWRIVRVKVVEQTRGGA